ncbi:MAG: arginine--tRNA ligase [Patescibacteria group bacterium]
MIISKLKNLLQTAITGAGFECIDFDITSPKDPKFGDYTTSVALAIAKKTKNNPMEIAKSICDQVVKNDTDKIIGSAEALSPGFINIFVSNTVLLTSITQIGNDKDKSLSGEKIMVEFTDPNPFKEFHIGHLYSNAVGESLARLIETQGATVKRVCYQGDVGIHVACSVWGMTKEIPSSKFPASPAGRQIPSSNSEERLKEFSNKTLQERVSWLGACYAFGATAYKEDENAKKEIQILNAQIFLAAQKMHLKSKPDFKPIVNYRSLFDKEIIPQDIVELYYETGRAWTLEYFETIYQKLGTKFEDYYFESEVGEYGYKTVKEHIADGVFEESNGAIVFPGDKHNLHTRVLINSLGLPTYEAKELGLNPKKYADWPFDKSIIVTANEIDEYFKVLLKAMSFVAPVVATKTKHISHGVVRLPEGKMSSRTGKILSGEWLINEAKSKLSKIVAENSRIEEGEKENTLDKLAVASIKYALLKSSVGRDVVFDFEESLSFEGNSGPYLLYTIVRCGGILEKSELKMGSDYKIEYPANIENLDLSLLRNLAKFDEILLQASDKLSPHILCNYLYSLAKEFSAYYEKVNILKSEGDLKNFRLYLVSKVKEFLTEGVNTLGFKEVERM